MTNTPYQLELDHTFTDKPIAELHRKLAFLLTTQTGTLPLDREFGIDFDFLDQPAEAMRSLFTAEVTVKVATYIPECRVKAVEWVSIEGGSVIPKVVITSA